jgi:uridine phosphorylase
MGAGSMEIVLNELAALREIEMTTGTRQEVIEPITIIRVGTSGALRQDTPLGSAIVSSAAVGLDSTGWFYDVRSTAAEQDLANVARERLESCLAEDHPARGMVHPYAASACPEVVEALLKSAHEYGVRAQKGVTVTAAGFFACQGRDVSRIPPAFPDLDRALANAPQFCNLEMETSILFRFSQGVGYRAGAICVAAAHRELNAFCEDLQGALHGVVRVALRALLMLER